MKRKEWLSCVEPGGKLIVSFWQFMNKSKYSRKIETFSDTGEENDFLLLFGSNSEAKRYCHHFGDEEVRWYGEQLGCEFDEISGVGNDVLNRYLLLTSR